MNPKTRELLDRTLQLAIDVISFSHTFPRNVAGYTIAKQLIRSASSVGANLREAHRARSTPEFVSKIQICLQEASETEYWLQVSKGSKMGDALALQALLRESGELIAIFAAITRTTKSRRARPR